MALRLEAALWQEIDAVHALASKLRERVQPLPSGIACLRPMAQQRGQQEEQQGGAGAGPQPAAAAAAGEAADAAAVVGAHPDYPALRRVQRLSHAATAMLANVSQTEGRQGWIECGSICARLRLSLASLRKHRQVGGAEGWRGEVVEGRWSEGDVRGAPERSSCSWGEPSPPARLCQCRFWQRCARSRGSDMHGTAAAGRALAPQLDI